TGPIGSRTRPPAAPASPGPPLSCPDAAAGFAAARKSGSLPIDPVDRLRPAYTGWNASGRIAHGRYSIPASQTPPDNLVTMPTIANSVWTNKCRRPLTLSAQLNYDVSIAVIRGVDNDNVSNN